MLNVGLVVSIVCLMLLSLVRILMRMLLFGVIIMFVVF